MTYSTTGILLINTRLYIYVYYFTYMSVTYTSNDIYKICTGIRRTAVRTINICGGDYVWYDLFIILNAQKQTFEERLRQGFQCKEK